MTTHIEFNDLSLGYRNHTVLHNCNAQIAHGEFITILGENASGKTTLLRAILGTLPPTSGSITVFKRTPSRTTARHIGYMPQAQPWLDTHYLHGEAWLHANVCSFRWGLPRITQQAQDECEHLIHLVQAQDFIRKPLYTLSGGQRQRLLLAQALLGNPNLLLLDEPFMHLDPGFQTYMITLLHTIRKAKPLTVLLSSHDINPLLKITDRVLYLASGETSIGSVASVFTSENLSKLYKTAMMVIRHGDYVFITPRIIQ